MPPALKALHDRIEPATQLPDITSSSFSFSRALRQLQGKYHMQGESEDIWERDMSKNMWQDVLDVWFKHAIGLDISIADLPRMFTPPNEGPPRYSQNVYALMWHVVGNQEFDYNVQSRHEKVQLLSRDLQSTLQDVYSFDKNEYMNVSITCQTENLFLRK